MSKPPVVRPPIHTGLWQELSRECVYENPWIEVTHRQVVTPAGTDGIYGVVHFKNRAVGILPLDDEQNTWLVRQTRFPLGQASWEIPEGGSPKGESTLMTAKRELEEEVGLLASDWQPWLTLHLSNSVTDEVAEVFLAQGLRSGEVQHEDTEDIEVLKLPLIEAIDMVERGEITDAISVAALLKAAIKLI